ncbi:unnamed protein product, partial [Musa textilis]
MDNRPVAKSNKNYHATNPPVVYKRRVRRMGEGDLLSMFSKEFIGVALRPWTREEDKLFKRALVVYPKGTPVR